MGVSISILFIVILITIEIVNTSFKNGQASMTIAFQMFL